MKKFTQPLVLIPISTARSSNDISQDQAIVLKATNHRFLWRFGSGDFNDFHLSGSMEKPDSIDQRQFLIFGRGGKYYIIDDSDNFENQTKVVLN